MKKLKKINHLIIEDDSNIEYKNKGYKPVYVVDSAAKILIIGQAPGIKAQESGRVFEDKSGNELRNWLGVSYEEFYNKENFAILPMDFFYPGSGKTGDLPPRKDFAEKWHSLIINELKEIKLIILMGNYAIKYYLGDKYQKNLTNTVRNYYLFLPKYFPIVHSSPLNFRWHAKNPWFKKEVVPKLSEIVSKIIKG